MPFTAFAPQNGKEHEDHVQAQALDVNRGQVMGGSGGNRNDRSSDPGRLKGIIEALSSNRIKNDVVTFAIRLTPYVRIDIGLFVIDHTVGAQFEAKPNLAIIGCRGMNLGPKSLGQLKADMTDAPAGCVNKDFLP